METESRPSVRTAIVAIGRNEGERLVRCLAALRPTENAVVYVDSGSSDGSAAHARAQGACVVDLDPAQPFTAARARNEGFECVMRAHPDCEYVQFVDGDSELDADWLAHAVAHADRHADVAIVCGRLGERDSDATRWKRLAAFEWGRFPIGEIRAPGGNALIRASVFSSLGGFRPGMASGEEAEFCTRVRQAGHRCERIDREMALHDARMSGFGEWWRRQVAAGAAYAENFARARDEPAQPARRKLASIGFWAGLLPLAVLGFAVPTAGLSLVGVAGYGILWWRIYRTRDPQRESRRDTAWYATTCVIGMFAQAVGVLRYGLSRRRR